MIRTLLWTAVVVLYISYLAVGQVVEFSGRVSAVTPRTLPDCDLPSNGEPVGESLADMVRAELEKYIVRFADIDTMVCIEVGTDSLRSELEKRPGCIGVDGLHEVANLGPHDCQWMDISLSLLDSLGYGPEAAGMYLVKKTDQDWLREWLKRNPHAIRVDQTTGDSLFTVAIKLKSDDTSELEALGINCLPISHGSGFLDLPVGLLREVRELPSVQSMRPMSNHTIHTN